MKNILVIKLGALGDFILSLGPMAAIRRAHPDAQITLMTTKPFAKMGEDCGYFDDVLIDQKPKWHELGRWLDLRKTLIDAQFDRVYDLQNNDRTNSYFKLFLGATTPEWNGAAKKASHCNAAPSRITGSAHAGHVQTLAVAGIEDVGIDDLTWMKDLSQAEEQFNIPKPYVLLMPGCAPTRPEKRWPAEKFGGLANALLKEGITPVLIGTKADAKANDIVHSLCPHAINLTDKTALYDIPALAHGAAGVIGNDTGPMHMSTVTGCPCVILYHGGANIVKHAPLGDDVTTIQKETMADISVQDVLDSFQPR